MPCECTSGQIRVVPLQRFVLVTHCYIFLFFLILYFKRSSSSDPLNTKIPPIPYFFVGRLVWISLIPLACSWTTPPKCCTIRSPNSQTPDRPLNMKMDCPHICGRPVPRKRGLLVLIQAVLPRTRGLGVLLYGATKKFERQYKILKWYKTYCR